MEQAEHQPRANVAHFGAFEADLSSGELRKHGTLLHLQEQPFKVLAALLARPGEVVSREELVNLLWPDGTFVDYDRGLNAAISRLRQVLSDSAETPRYVETVARRGYRFIGALASPPPPAPAPAKDASHRRTFWLAAGTAIPVLLIAGWLLWPRHQSRDPLLEPVPLTSYPGIETQPSFSPDGSQVAFSWNGENQDNFDIYVKTIGSDPPRRLTTDPARDRDPAWSPDGRYIAFRREGVGLFLIPPTGGAEKKLLDTRTTDQLSNARTLLRGMSGQISWKPDGTALAFAHEANGSEPAGISLVDVSTGTTRRLLTGRTGDSRLQAPAISPDGRTLAWSDCLSGSPCRLGLIDLELAPNGPLRYFETGAANGIAWSADSRRLVIGAASLSSRLWDVTVQNGARQQLSFGSDGSSPAVSRDGRRLAFSRASDNLEIWRLEKGRLARSPMSSTFVDQSAQFSPDGARVAFMSNRSGTAEIWVAQADGSNPVPLTASPRFVGSPQWSHDGRKIVVDTAASNGSYDVSIVDAANGRITPFVRHPSDDVAPSFSRDDKWIYFSSSRSGRNEVYRMPVAGGGEAVRLTENGGWAALESVDGKSIYYSKVNVTCGSPLFVRSLAGGPERKIIDSACGRGFTVTKRGIYYTDGTEKDGVLRVYLYDTGTGTTQIVEQTGNTLYGFHTLTVSRDDTILITGSTQTGADLYLVEDFR